MTREELLGLPPAIAIRVILETLLEVVPALGPELKKRALPKVPRAPKYDQVIYRKGGHSYASECDLESLRYWHKTYLEGAAKGGEYAEKDKKRADSLQYWIDWRACEPSARWSGKRDKTDVTAAAPAAKPAIYEKKGAAAQPGASETANENDTDGDAPIQI